MEHDTLPSSQTENRTARDHNATSRLSLRRRRVLQTSAIVGLGLVGVSGTVLGDRDPGDVLWESERLGEHRSQPTVVDDIVYAGGDRFYAFDAASGEEIDFTSPTTRDSSPNVVDGVAYVSGTDSSTYAVEFDESEQRLQERWEYEATGANGYSPTVADGTVFFGDDDGTVYAIDADSGDEQWTYDEYDHPIEGSPTVVDGVVYVGAGDIDQGGGPTGGVYALEADTGEERWIVEDSADGFAWQAESPTVADGTVYVATTRGGAGGESGLFAFDADSGDEQWALDDEGAVDEWGLSPPTIYDDTIYVSVTNAIRAINAADGSLEWNEVVGESMTTPTVAEGTVFAGVSDGSVLALEAASGDTVWQVDLESENYDDVTIDTGRRGGASPMVVNGTLFIGAENQGGRGGAMFAIDAGIDGHSQDSAVTLGTRGHHHEWAGTDAPTEPYAPPDDDASADDADDSDDADDTDDTPADDDSDDGADDEPAEATGEDESDGSPAPGLIGTLAAMTATGYALARRRATSDEGQ